MSTINPADNFDFTSIGVKKATDKTADEVKDPNSLGKGEFLTLLLAQLKNQDPTAPQENGEFMAQLAQFSILDAASETNNKIEQLITAVTSDQALEATSMVGRNVMVPASEAALTKNGLSGIIDVPVTTSDLQITIKNNRDEVVYQQALGIQDRGQVNFKWDGLDKEGQSFPIDDTYEVVATATIDDVPVQLSTSLSYKVESVTLGKTGGALILNLPNGKQVSLNEVEVIL